MKDLLNTSFLFASLLWGSIGIGYFVYGKKQSSMMPMIGGVLMIGASYVVTSWLLMSVICIGLIATVHWLLRQGY